MSEYYLQPKANATKEWQLCVGGWLRNSGWHCVLCTLCLPAKMHVNETTWSEICKHAAKMHFVLCKGKSIGAWLGFALPDLPNVMTMPAARCLSTHTLTHTLTNSYSSMRLSLSLSVFGFVIHLSQVLCG